MTITKNVKIVTVPFLLLCFINPAYSISIIEYEEAFSSQERKGIIRLYISGIGSGMMWSNIELESRGEKPLYCQPEKIALNTGNYIRIINDELAKDELTEAEKELSSVAKYIMKGLISTFPCPK